MENKHYDVVILGGLGHVGLPLGLVMANKGLRVCLYDINTKTAELVNKGIMPFIEYDAEPLLQKVLEKGMLEVSLNKEVIRHTRFVITAIGTPIDEFLNPKTRQFLNFFIELKEYLSPNQTIIIRSTVYPNTISQIKRVLGETENWKIAYCPERIVQGYSVKELHELPQIVAGLTDEAQHEAAELFSKISPKIIFTSMGEAELVKLFSNAWRYIQFAATNQFYMIAENFGVDYNKVRFALTEGYGRTANLPSAGFAAGPCLLKDTMQLASFDSTNFLLGHSAMMVNEGLPNFVVEKLKVKYDISKTRIGILGMAFKADIDDIRDSLSFKLWKILRFYGGQVLCSDEFATNDEFVNKEYLIQNSDVIIIGVPHKVYKETLFSEDKYIVDVWNIIKHINA